MLLLVQLLLGEAGGEGCRVLRLLGESLHACEHASIRARTWLAFRSTPCLARASCVMPSPKGRLPYSIW